MSPLYLCLVKWTRHIVWNTNGSTLYNYTVLKQVLDSILTFGEDELVEGLKAFIEAIVNENVSLVISRQLLSEVKFFSLYHTFSNKIFAQVGNTLTQLEDSVSKAVSHFTLEVVQPRVISFEDQVELTISNKK